MMEDRQQTASNPLICKYKRNYFSLPKQFYLPADVPYTNSSNRYEGDVSEQIPSEMGEHSTKNSSFLKSSKAQSSLAARSSHQPPLRNRKCTIEKQVSKE